MRLYFYTNLKKKFFYVVSYKLLINKNLRIIISNRKKLFEVIESNMINLIIHFSKPETNLRATLKLKIILFIKTNSFTNLFEKIDIKTQNNDDDIMT